MYLELGKIVGFWGVKGWIKVHSYTRERQDIAKYATWYLSRAESSAIPTLTHADVSPKALIECRAQGKGLVAKLSEVETRELAESLIGQSILVKTSDLPKLPEGEYYWHQLIGLTVVNETAELGQVEALMETGANDVLSVAPRDESGQESQRILIPYNSDRVLSVDLDTQQITVDWDAEY